MQSPLKKLMTLPIKVDSKTEIYILRYWNNTCTYKIKKFLIFLNLF